MILEVAVELGWPPSSVAELDDVELATVAALLRERARG